MNVSLRTLGHTALMVLVFIGCGKRNDGPVVLSTKHWAPGQEAWYLIEVIDSVYGMDEAYEKKKVNKSVQFKILDTTDHGTIEWNEYVLMNVSDSTSTSNDLEWVLMYQFVYRCNEHGDIIHVLNYSDVKAYIDTMISTYIDQFEGEDRELVDRVARSFADSTWVMTSLLNEATLLHRLFSLDLHGTDTLVSFSMQPASEDLQPYYLCQTPNAICHEGNVSVKGWGSCGSVDLNAFMTERIGEWDRIDRLDLPVAVGHEEMTACFDTLRSLPTYLSFRRVMSIEEKELVQRRLIFIQEEPKQ